MRRLMAAMLAFLSVMGACVGQEGSWTRVGGDGFPSGGSGSLVLDASRQVMVWVPLRRNGLDQFSAWEWDGKSWSGIPTSTFPMFLGQTQACYDPHSKRVVVLRSDGFYPSETWTWDGKTLTQLQPRNRPSGDGVMALDPARKRIVLFGGSSGDETWEWDGQDWTLCKTSTAPGARRWCSLTFDPVRNCMLLFAGQAKNNGALLADTWSWDGARWTQLHPTTSPQAQAGQTMGYDPVRKRVILLNFGPDPWKPWDTWEWDGKDWSRVAMAVQPTPRSLAGLTYDPIHKRMMLVGGEWAGPLVDILYWDGKNWQQDPATRAPAWRFDSRMVYDVARSRFVLFGGATGNGFLADTWEFIGNRWFDRHPAVSPPPRSLHGMAYDSTRRRTVLYGGRGSTGYLGDTWEWDGINWIQRNPLNSPGARIEFAMVYDSIRKVTILQGGYGSANGMNDTWEWNGKDWKRVGSLSHWSGASTMSFDAARGVAVLDMDSRAAEWDGSSWTVHSSNYFFKPHRMGASIYDTAYQEVLSLGGIYISGWHMWFGWDGLKWTMYRWNETGPAINRNHSMAYDSRLQRVLRFGGMSSGNQTWVWRRSFRSLTTNTARISRAGGGTQEFQLDAGVAHANKTYLLLGCIGDRTQSIALGKGVHLPLRVDEWFGLTLAYPNLVISNSLGTLDAAGRGRASFRIDNRIPPALVGQTFDHAFVVLGKGPFDFASNAMPLVLDR